MTNWKENNYPFKKFTEEITQEWMNCGFNKKQTREWLESGLQPNDAGFAQWLRNFKNKDAEWLLDYNDEGGLKKEYRKYLKKKHVNAQEWLDKNYPKEKREKTKVVYLNEPSLEGRLDLGNFTWCYDDGSGGVEVYVSTCVDETKLKIRNKPKKAEIIRCTNAQEYVNKNYPTQEERKKVMGELYIREKNLEGELDLSDFVNLRSLFCTNNNKLTSFNLSGCYKLEKINCSDNQLVDLDITKNSKITNLDCGNNKLTSLDLSNCSHLTELDCKGNLLTSLTLPNNSVNLKKLNLSDNNFSATQDLSFLAKAINLEELDLENSGLHLKNDDYDYHHGEIIKQRIKQNIYNRFTGSLDFLSGMKNLKTLDIDNTDLNEVNIDKLPNSLEWINYYTELRPTCKLNEIVPQLKKYTGKWKELGFSLRAWKKWEKSGFNKEEAEEWIKAGIEPNDYNFVSWLRDGKKVTPEWVLSNKESKKYQMLKDRCNDFGWCFQCQQPNTSQNWCQPCTEKEWKEDLEQLTGQELVNKFIQQQQARKIDEDRKLKWIPYQEFISIEYIASGGFSEIYKAEWQKENETLQKVVLKILNNSQNITFGFLQEIANNKLVDGRSSAYFNVLLLKYFVESKIVDCYGISQDPKTKSYVMVMQYIPDGDLRHCLQKKGRELSLRKKNEGLLSIAEGLKIIHEQSLVHHDFHSGNILSNICNYEGEMHMLPGCCITDLGLARPANYQPEEGKIFGVLPYVAPEVLRGQSYTQASDIYSFGIIAYELFANAYPYPKMDDMTLALKICQGLRPNIDKVPLSQELKSLIKRCWDANPEQRPGAKELYDFTIKNIFINQQLEQEYNHFSQNTPYKIHPNATLTSKMINTKEITKKLDSLELLGIGVENLNVQSNNEKTDKEFREENEIFLKESEEITPVEIQPQPTEWTNHSFTYQQTQDWINIGLRSTDANFAAWLRDIKGYTPEWVLNHGDQEKLNQEFFQWWQQNQFQTNIEQPPK